MKGNQYINPTAPGNRNIFNDPSNLSSNRKNNVKLQSLQQNDINSIPIPNPNSNSNPIINNEILSPLSSKTNSLPPIQTQFVDAKDTPKSIKSQIPDNINIYDVPNVAAGIPILELVRKLEEERVLSRDDRLAFFDALSDETRREKLIQALIEVELGSNPRFAIRRLKAHIYQNPGGLPNGKTPLPSISRNRSTESSQNMFMREQAGIYQQNGNITNMNILSNINNKHIDEDTKNMIQPELASMQQQQQQDKYIHSNSNLNLNPNASNSPNKKTRKSPSKSPSKNEEDDGSYTTKVNITEAVSQIVGEIPVYKHDYNIFIKFEQRLKEYLLKYRKLKSKNRRKLGIIVGSGSCNPLTRMHMRRFYLAKQYLESRSDIFILGSLVSPTHGTCVRERYRTTADEILPTPHRLALSQLLVTDSKWLTIDPWEATRKCAMDYLSLLEHTREMVMQHTMTIEHKNSKGLITTLSAPMKDFDIHIYYLCKPSSIPLLSPVALKQYNFNAVCVCRPQECDYLRSNVGSKWNGIIHIVEDDAILDASVDIISSKKIREKIKKYEDVTHLMGGFASEYLGSHQIGEKVGIYVCICV